MKTNNKMMEQKQACRIHQGFEIFKQNKYKNTQKEYNKDKKIK